MTSSIHEEYWLHCERGEFQLRRCQDCGAWQFPPATGCATCLSRNLVWQPASGRGRLWSWVRIHQAYYPHLKDRLPYNVAMIELAEGPLMISSLVGDDAERAQCDAPVELVFEEDNGKQLPKFRLA